MPRPKKPRYVLNNPRINAFAPRDISTSEKVILPVEGFEAIRLSDYEHLDQETASLTMNVSRQTYGRILSNARGIISEAIVTGKTLIISGGNYETGGKEHHRCRQCRNGRRRGRQAGNKE